MNGGHVEGVVVDAAHRARSSGEAAAAYFIPGPITVSLTVSGLIPHQLRQGMRCAQMRMRSCCSLALVVLALGFLLPLVSAQPSEAKGAADLDPSSLQPGNDDGVQAEEESHSHSHSHSHSRARAMLGVYKLYKPVRKPEDNKINDCNKAKEMKKCEKRGKRKIRVKRFPRVPRQHQLPYRTAAPPPLRSKKLSPLTPHAAPPPLLKPVYKKLSPAVPYKLLSPHGAPPPLASPASLPPPTAAPSVTASQKSYLDPHNVVRAKKRLAPLTWDSSLESYARSWGIHQRDTHNCNLQHSNGPYGENLFWGYGYPYGAADAVNSWTEEEPFYHYSSNSCDPGQMCGHYTQVVWKSTTKLGCANIDCKDGSIFIICSYNPPGNYIGERPY